MGPRDGDGADAVVRRLVRSAQVEVIPLRGAEEKVSALPRATPVTITCSPKFGLERTIAHAEHAAAAGYRVVPHLAARQVHDEDELRAVTGRLDRAGITDLYVVGGDAAEPAGPYGSSADLLDALAGIRHGITRIGVACYPEGHPAIPGDVLTRELLRKQRHAHYMVSQLCFDAAAVDGWLGRARAEGVSLPLRLGVSAPVKVRKLAELALRIGVGPSLRYLTKQHGLVGNLLNGAAYRPEDLLREIAERLSPEEPGVEGSGTGELGIEGLGIEGLGIEGLHIFSFNQIDVTADWRARLLAAEGDRTAPESLPGPVTPSLPGEATIGR